MSKERSRPGDIVSGVRLCWNPKCHYAHPPSATMCNKCGWTDGGRPGVVLEPAPHKKKLLWEPWKDIFPRPSAVQKPSFTIHVPPCSAPRQVRSDAWKPSKAVLRYRAWKDKVRPLLAAHGWELGDTLNIHFVIPMPKSWSKKKRELMDGFPHQQRSDIDNFLKAIMDLPGEDDGHVHTIYAKKTWGVDGSFTIYAECP